MKTFFIIISCLETNCIYFLTVIIPYYTVIKRHHIIYQFGMLKKMELNAWHTFEHICNDSLNNTLIIVHDVFKSRSFLNISALPIWHVCFQMSISSLVHRQAISDKFKSVLRRLSMNNLTVICNNFHQTHINPDRFHN